MSQLVTFDFDKCLSRPDVQEYAKELIDRGVDVWVVTSRYDNLHIHRYEGLIDEKNWGNSDIWEVVDRIGIPRWKVRFTNMEWKSGYLLGSNVIWHLDDNHQELYMIREAKMKTIGIQVVSGSWKRKCERLLTKKK